MKSICKSKMQREYHHSAYWYAYNCGYTHSEYKSLTAQYLDMHMYYGLHMYGKLWRPKDCPLFDTTFDPIQFGTCIAADIGIAMRDLAKAKLSAAGRERMKRELRRNLRIVRRPFYYARENRRRRELAEERRRIRQRTTTAPMPTPEELLEAWNVRKESKEAMIRLGGMLHDLECYVDNRLRFDGDGNVAGRNRGIRGWIDENLPELNDKYKTLMRYKAMAIKLRQATGTKDPVPTARLLEKPQNKLVKALLQDFRSSFSFLEDELGKLLDQKRIFEQPKIVTKPERRSVRRRRK